MDDEDHRRVESRAHLTPEERRAGSDDPEAQAEEILADSDGRIEHPESDARTSSQTIPVQSADES
jgi:hypothetical protein